MAVGDCYEIKVNWALGANSALNVFFYRQSVDSSPITVDIEGLLDAFEIEMVDPLRGCVVDDAFLTGVSVRNLFSPDEFAEVGYGVTKPGQVTDNPAAPFIAAELFQPRKRSDMRRGFKRLPFVPGSVALGNQFSSGYQTLMGIAALACSQTLATASNQFTPVIVKRIFTGIVGGKRTYRLPENQGEFVYYVADNWQVDGFITTQNTRKVYPA